jgi:hypothetical protein
MASRGGRISPRHLRKRKYNLACVEDEVSVRDILSNQPPLHDVADIINPHAIASKREPYSSRQISYRCTAQHFTVKTNDKLLKKHQHSPRQSVKHVKLSDSRHTS